MLEPTQYEGLLKAAKNLEVSDSLLRDWFAGQVLGNMGHKFSLEETAALSYKYADAMMKERSQRYKTLSSMARGS